VARGKRATQRDVAELAKVSTAVVSYVVNNGPRPTSPEVRRRVLAAIEALDYHPNGFARGLRAQRTNTVAFILYDFHPLDSFTSHYLGPITSAIIGDLTEHGYYLIIQPLKVGEDTASVERLLHSGRVDGVIMRMVQDPDTADHLPGLIRDSGLACVSIERQGHPDFPAVVTDDEAGAVAATSHLIERGHRRIALINGDPRFHTAHARERGFRAAMAEAGLEIDEAMIFYCNWSSTEAIDATRTLMAMPEPPTAIFCTSDDMAFGAMNALTFDGYRIPDDVAIVGFDDAVQAQHLIPALTTVRIPLTRIGTLAGSLVRAAIEGQPIDPIQQVLPVELVERGTT
jgi:DNA-binding LacI/PurR family transcriptional regulator